MGKVLRRLKRLSDRFVRTPYPRGLGTTPDTIEKLIAGNERAMLDSDQATRGTHGGARAVRYS